VQTAYGFSGEAGRVVHATFAEQAGQGTKNERAGSVEITTKPREPSRPRDLTEHAGQSNQGLYAGKERHAACTESDALVEQEFRGTSARVVSLRQPMVC